MGYKYIHVYSYFIKLIYYAYTSHIYGVFSLNVSNTCCIKKAYYFVNVDSMAFMWTNMEEEELIDF